MWYIYYIIQIFQTQISNLETTSKKKRNTVNTKVTLKLGYKQYTHTLPLSSTSALCHHIQTHTHTACVTVCAALSRLRLWHDPPSFASGHFSVSLSLEERSSLSRKHLGEMTGWGGTKKCRRKTREVESLNIWVCVDGERGSEGRNTGWRKEGTFGERADGETNRIWWRRQGVAREKQCKGGDEEK